MDVLGDILVPMSRPPNGSCPGRGSIHLGEGERGRKGAGECYLGKKREGLRERIKPPRKKWRSFNLVEEIKMTKDNNIEIRMANDKEDE